MYAGFLVLVLAVPLLLVGPLLAGLLAWFLLRPAEGEPPARARLRRGTGTTAAVATTVSVLVLLPSLVLALSSPAAGAVGLLVAGLLHVATLWVGEALTARPHAARRSALLAPGRSSLLHAVLLGVVAVSAVGVLVVLGASLARALPQAAGLPEVVPPRVGLVLLVPTAVLAVLVALALRQVHRRPTDGRLDPVVDAAGRARAVHRLLRAGAGSGAAVLGLLLAEPGLRSRSLGGSLGDGETAALAAAGVVLLVAAVVSLLPPPALPVRPDRTEVAGDPTGPHGRSDVATGADRGAV